MTVTDPQGKTGTDTVEIVVTAAGQSRRRWCGRAADPRSGVAPLDVEFSAQAIDADGDSASELTYMWDFGDGGANAFGRNAEHTYREPGTYTATVTATDRLGAFDTAEVVIEVGDPPGNVPPVVQAAAAPRSGTAPLVVSFTLVGHRSGRRSGLDGVGLRRRRAGGRRRHRPHLHDAGHVHGDGDGERSGRA